MLFIDRVDLLQVRGIGKQVKDTLQVLPCKLSVGIHANISLTCRYPPDIAAAATFTTGILEIERFYLMIPGVDEAYR